MLRGSKLWQEDQCRRDTYIFYIVGTNKTKLALPKSLFFLGRRRIPSRTIQLHVRIRGGLLPTSTGGDPIRAV